MEIRIRTKKTWSFDAKTGQWNMDTDLQQWSTILDIGNQTFVLRPVETKNEADWYAKMLGIALSKVCSSDTRIVIERNNLNNT